MPVEPQLVKAWAGFAACAANKTEEIMQRLDEAERRLSAAIRRAENRLNGAKTLGTDVHKGLELIGSIETRAKTAMQQIEQLIAQGRDERRG